MLINTSKDRMCWKWILTTDILWYCSVFAVASGDYIDWNRNRYIQLRQQRWIGWCIGSWFQQNTSKLQGQRRSLGYGSNRGVFTGNWLIKILQTFLLRRIHFLIGVEFVIWCSWNVAVLMDQKIFHPFLIPLSCQNHAAPVCPKTKRA